MLLLLLLLILRLEIHGVTIAADDMVGCAEGETCGVVRMVGAVGDGGGVDFRGKRYCGGTRAGGRRGPLWPA